MPLRSSRGGLTIGDGILEVVMAVLRNIRAYMRPIKSPTHRGLILAELKRKGFTFGPMNDPVREMLQDAIFVVENDLESMVGECDPNHLASKMKKRKEWVRQMREARNLVCTDLGFNEDASKDAP
jgi:hypothetical protein